MELLALLAFSFFSGGFIIYEKNKKEKSKQKEEYKKELFKKDKIIKELESWKKDREAKEYKNSELIAEIQKQEREIAQNRKLNNEAINNLKNNQDYKIAIKKVEELSNKLRKSIAKIESDFSKRIASFADAGNEPKGLNLIDKEKNRLKHEKILPNPYSDLDFE